MAYASHTLNYTADVAANAATAIDVGGTPDFYQVLASGDFGGGTLTIHLSPDGGTTYYSTGLSLTAAGLLTVNVKDGDKIKLVLAGSTSPDIDISVR